MRTTLLILKILDVMSKNGEGGRKKLCFIFAQFIKKSALLKRWTLEMPNNRTYI